MFMMSFKENKYRLRQWQSEGLETWVIESFTAQKGNWTPRGRTLWYYYNTSCAPSVNLLISQDINIIKKSAKAHVINNLDGDFSRDWDHHRHFALTGNKVREITLRYWSPRCPSFVYQFSHIDRPFTSCKVNLSLGRESKIPLSSTACRFFVPLTSISASLSLWWARWSNEHRWILQVCVAMEVTTPLSN